MKKKLDRGWLNNIATHWTITEKDAGRELLVIPAGKRQAERALNDKIQKILEKKDNEIKKLRSENEELKKMR